MGTVIYTDANGKGYDLPALTAAWNDPTFRGDPINARVGDILASYGGSAAAPAAPTPPADPTSNYDTNRSANTFATTTAPSTGTPARTAETGIAEQYPSQFTNTAAKPFTGPSGIPGQTYTTPDGTTVQYDTTGYIMGSTYDPTTGKVTIPNPVTGKTSTEYVNPQTGGQMGSPGEGVPVANQPTPTNPFGVTSVKTPTSTTGGGGGGSSSTQLSPDQWRALALATYGPQPTIPNVAPFSYPAFNQPAPYVAPAPFSYAPFNAPAPFSAPSGQDVLNADPGYQFRLSQGTGALEASAASKGVLNTGGTLSDLINYGQSAASQEYGNAYDRALTTYNTNYNDPLNAWIAGHSAALADYTTNTATGLNAYNTNFNDPLAAWTAGQTAAQNAYNTNYTTQVQNPYLAAVGQFNENALLQNQLFTQKQTTTP